MHAARPLVANADADAGARAARGRTAGPAALRGAIACLVALGVVKAAAAAYGIGVALAGAALPGAPEALRAAAAARPAAIGVALGLWYGGNAAIALATAAALARGRQWARWLAPVYGGLHAFGFAGLWFFGAVVLLNGALGIAAAVLVMLAGTRAAPAPGAAP